MPHQRRSLQKRKLQADISSDDCDDDGDSQQSNLQNDFPTDDVMQHRMQRKARTSMQGQQPKSERQQAALFRRLEAAEAGPDRQVPSTCGRGSLGKHRGSLKSVDWRNRHGETMLHKLVTYGTVAEIEQLIKHGADVNARDNADWTALHEACLKGLPYAVECLLKAGADVNVAADGGTTPLHDAAFSGSLKVVEMLLHHGADTSRTDRSCCTPLDVSSSSEVTKCLLDHMHRTTEESTGQPRGSGSSEENASCGHSEACVVDAGTETSGLASPSGCSTTAPPSLENCSLRAPDRSPARKETASRSPPGDGPYALYGPYMDPPRSLSASPTERRAEPSPSASLTLVVESLAEQSPAMSSPSISASASSSALTVSSTSVAASPSTSVIALSVPVSEPRARVTRSRTRSLMGATSGVAGVGGDALNGDRRSMSSRAKSERRGSESASKDGSSPDRDEDALLCPVAAYEDISDVEDGEDVSLQSCPAEAPCARPTQGPAPRVIFLGSNFIKRNENSMNSVGVPSSSNLPHAKLTGVASKGNRSTVLDFHSYSQSEHTGHLPAGRFNNLKWMSSKWAGGGAEERELVLPRLVGIPVSRLRDERKVNGSFAGGTVSSGKAQLSHGCSDLSDDSAGKTPRDMSQFRTRLIRESGLQEDCRAVSDQRNGQRVIPALSPCRVEPRGLSGLRCDVCIPRPSLDSPMEENVVVNCSDAVATPEVNNNIGNGFCVVPSKLGNSFQRAVALVDRGTSDKTRPQKRKLDEDNQDVALDKLGRDIVVFLRKATFDVQSGMRHVVLPKAVGLSSQESLPGRTFGESVQRPNEGRCYVADSGSQSGVERMTTDGTKQRIVLRDGPARKGPAPVILQKDRVFDWTRRSGANSTILVDKSTMTVPSDWELTEMDQSDGVASLNSRTGRPVAKMLMGNIAGDTYPVGARNVLPDGCAFRMCSDEWKSSALRLLGESSGSKKTFDGCSQSADILRSSDWHRYVDGPGRLRRTETHDDTASRSLVAPYHATFQSKLHSDSACDPFVATSNQFQAANAVSIPFVNNHPAVSTAGELPTKVRVLCGCEQKLMGVCPPANFRGSFERAEGEPASEHRCRPFARKLKPSNETPSCRKESGVAKNVGARKKNAKSDRVGQMEEDVPSEQHSIGSETDSSRQKRAAGFGSGIGVGCGPGKGGKQTRIARERDLPVQTKANNVVTEPCSTESVQPRDGDNDACQSKKKQTTNDFVLWHGLCSKTSGSLFSLTSDERETSSVLRGKPQFPKEFEKFLTATREYNIRSSNLEILPPAGLDLPLRKLFVRQENERLKLKQEQNMRWERLLLTIEAEVMREYVEEERRLETFRPVSSCSLLCLQNFCSRGHANRVLESQAQDNLKSRLRGLKEKFLQFEADLHFQLQNEISVLYACQVQEWERLLASRQPVNSKHASPQLCVSKVAGLKCLVSAFFDKLNLCQ